MEEDQSNSSLCFQFDERDVETITKVKMGLGGGGVLTSILAIAIIAASKRFRRKFIYRLVGYLMFTALLESVAYILEEVPLDYSSNHVALRNETIFKILCVGAGVYAQFNLQRGWKTLWYAGSWYTYCCWRCVTMPLGVGEGENPVLPGRSVESEYRS